MKITMEDGRVLASPETPEELRRLLNNAIIGSNAPRNSLFCPVCPDRHFATMLGLKVHMGRIHADIGAAKALATR